MNKWGVLFATGMGTFMSALDGSAVNAILPVVRSTFGCQVETIEWVITIYLLVVSALLLTFGRLGDLKGHKRVYVSGFAIFIAASAICGLSQSPGMLITMRGIQALGAAMLFANSPAILTAHFPPEERGRALGMMATMTYLGLTVGPSLGGLLADRLSWRAIFYVNLPVGGLATLLSILWIPGDPPRETRAPFDRIGALAFMAGLIALLLALNQGHEWGWGSTRILLLLGSSAAILAAFLRIESRGQNPMLDLTLFRDRIFAAATMSALMNYVALFTVTFVLPFYLIQGRGMSPSRAGLLLTAQPIAMAIAAPLSGILSDRAGSRIPSTAGMLIMSVGLILLARLDGSAPVREIVAALAVVGLGTGIFIAPNSSALMGAAPRNRQGIASGILATARNVGMVLGVGLSGAIFTTVLERRGGIAAGGALFAGVRASFVAGSIVAVWGAVTSAARGTRA